MYNQLSKEVYLYTKQCSLANENQEQLPFNSADPLGKLSTIFYLTFCLCFSIRIVVLFESTIDIHDDWKCNNLALIPAKVLK